MIVNGIGSVQPEKQTIYRRSLSAPYRSRKQKILAPKIEANALYSLGLSFLVCKIKKV